MNTYTVIYRIGDVRREIKFKQALAKLNCSNTYRLDGFALLKNTLTYNQVGQIVKSFVKDGDQVLILETNGKGVKFGFDTPIADRIKMEAQQY